MPGVPQKIAGYIGSREFDFVIASQHTIKEKRPIFRRQLRGKTLRQAQREYLEEMLFDLEHYEDFDVAGHIGYLDKYLPNIDSLKEKNAV